MDIKSFKLPDDVNYIISLLKGMGYTAYAVGGCVRDILMMKEPHDYDICTSATVEEMEDIFTREGLKIYETGIKHGTISVSINDVLYEITTYRVDGEYEDSRHPKDVKFVKNVEEDLARRDFTINAMAYDGSVFIDLFEGRRDIKEGLIKCVGDPEKRFNEDALRILRAIRFAVRYNFKIEKKTKESIMKNMYLLKNISMERISSEFTQIILEANEDQMNEYRDVFAVFIPEIREMFDFAQKTPWHKYDVWNHSLKVMENVPKTPVTKLAGLFHDIGKPAVCKEHDGVRSFKGHEAAGSEIAKKILKRMRYDSETIERVCRLIRFHDFHLTNNRMSAKLVLAIMKEDAFNLIDLEKADRIGQRTVQDIISAEKHPNDQKIEAIRKQFFDACRVEDMMKEILRDKECYLLKDMAINGRDLIEIGFKPDKNFKYVLNGLLLLVMTDNNLNRKNTLIAIAHKLRETMKYDESY